MNNNEQQYKSVAAAISKSTRERERERENTFSGHIEREVRSVQRTRRMCNGHIGEEVLSVPTRSGFNVGTANCTGREIKNTLMFPVHLLISKLFYT